MELLEENKAMGEQKDGVSGVGQIEGTAAVTPWREQQHLFFSEGEVKGTALCQLRGHSGRPTAPCVYSTPLVGRNCLLLAPELTFN